MKKLFLVLVLLLVSFGTTGCTTWDWWCEKTGWDFTCTRAVVVQQPAQPDAPAAPAADPATPVQLTFEQLRQQQCTGRAVYFVVGNVTFECATGLVVAPPAAPPPQVANAGTLPDVQPQQPSLACEISTQELAQLRDTAAVNAVDNLDAVGRLVAALDMRWESISTPSNVCGEWKNLPGNVPGDAVLWTNFHHQSGRYPVQAFRVDGDYGVFTSSAALTIVDYNSGGRWFHLTGSATPAQMGTCVDSADAEQLRGGVASYDPYFDRVGHGSAVKLGESVTGPGYFEGTFGAGQEPASLGQAWDRANNGGGFVWYIPDGVSVTAPNGGRFLAACR